MLLLPGLALCFAAGVALAFAASPPPVASAVALALGLVVLLLALRRPEARGAGALLAAVALVAGLLRASLIPAPPVPSGPDALPAQSWRGLVERGPLPDGAEGWWADVSCPGPDGAPARVRLHGTGEAGGIGPGEAVAFRSEWRRRRPTGNPGARAPDPEGARWSAWTNALVRLGGAEESSWVQRRHALALRLHALAGEREGGTIAALALGEKALLRPEDRAAFAATGTAHTLAVSGLHLGLVALWAHFLLRWLWTRSAWLLLRVRVDRIVALSSIGVMVGFTLWTGAAVATTRACLMGCLWLLARVLDGEMRAPEALAAAALVVLAIDPEALASPSFQLSVSAVTGILLLGPLGRRGHARWFAAGRMGPLLLRAGRGLWDALWVSLGAGLATAPVIAAHFHQAAPAALFANLFAVPLLGLLVLPAALLAVLALALAPPGWHETLLALPRALTGLWLDGVESLAAVSWAPPSAAEAWALLASGLGALLLLSALRAPRPRRWLTLALALVLTATPTALPLLRPSPAPGFRAHVLNVGHGVSTLLLTAEGERWLVDGGGGRDGSPGVGRARVLPALRALGVGALDRVVMSHGHADHAVGLLEVMAALPVGELWLPDAESDSPYGPWLRRLALSRGRPSRAVGAGHRHGTAELLWPPNPAPLPGENDRSLVLRLRAPGGRLLLPGDIETGAEALLAASGRDARAEVLVAPHHGSHTSSSEALLEAVRPRAVIFPRGPGERPALPRPEVAARYRARGAILFDTARDGAVEIRATATGIGLRGARRGPEGPRRCWWLGPLDEALRWCR